MPRRKIVRTFEEEEDFQRKKRERKAKSQAERREAKRMLAKKDDQLNANQIYSNLTQTSTCSTLNIMHKLCYISPMKIVHSTNEITSQVVSTSTITTTYAKKR